jgi:hypothetical protein
MKPKFRITQIFEQLVILISFSACEKDVFKVKTEKHFNRITLYI